MTKRKHSNSRGDILELHVYAEHCVLPDKYSFPQDMPIVCCLVYFYQKHHATLF